jgi:hypothetical protein
MIGDIAAATKRSPKYDTAIIVSAEAIDDRCAEMADVSAAVPLALSCQLSPAANTFEQSLN